MCPYHEGNCYVSNLSGLLYQSKAKNVHILGSRRGSNITSLQSIVSLVLASQRPVSYPYFTILHFAILPVIFTFNPMFTYRLKFHPLSLQKQC